MASKWYNRGLEKMASTGYVNFESTSNTFEVALTRSTGYTFASTHATVADLGANWECSSTDYVRKALVGRTVAQAGGILTFNSSDPVWTTLTGGVAVKAAIVYYKGSTAPAAQELLWYNEDASALTPNGGQVTLQFSTNGIATISAT